MAAQLSTDDERIEGLVFPESAGLRFSVERDKIIGLQETVWDDATGTGNTITITMIMFGANNIPVVDTYDTIIALWTQKTGS